MIDTDFQNFFLAIAGASAGLIGLLFVAVSVAPERVLGDHATGIHQIRASMALSSFVSTLVLALIALLPNSNIAWPATIIGVTGITYVANAARNLHTDVAGETRTRAAILIAVFGLAMAYLTSSGIRLLIDPRTHGAVTAAAVACIALIALGIDRAWELVGGRSTGVAARITDRIAGAEPSLHQIA
jgi:hypothetical protein